MNSANKIITFNVGDKVRLTTNADTLLNNDTHKDIKDFFDKNSFGAVKRIDVLKSKMIPVRHSIYAEERLPDKSINSYSLNGDSCHINKDGIIETVVAVLGEPLGQTIVLGLSQLEKIE